MVTEMIVLPDHEVRREQTVLTKNTKECEGRLRHGSVNLLSFQYQSLNRGGQGA